MFRWMCWLGLQHCLWVLITDFVFQDAAVDGLGDVHAHTATLKDANHDLKANLADRRRTAALRIQHKVCLVVGISTQSIGNPCLNDVLVA